MSGRDDGSRDLDPGLDADADAEDEPRDSEGEVPDDAGWADLEPE